MASRLFQPGEKNPDPVGILDPIAKESPVSSSILRIGSGSRGTTTRMAPQYR